MLVPPSLARTDGTARAEPASGQDSDGASRTSSYEVTYARPATCRRGHPDRPTNPTAGQHRQSDGESDQPGDPAPILTVRRAAPHRWRDVDATLASGHLDASTRRALQEARARTKKFVESRGAARQGAHELAP